MNQLSITVPIGLGDLIYLRAMLDEVKHNFSQIKIKFHKEIIKSYGFDPEYSKFLDDIGQLLFSEIPYMITEEEGIPFYGLVTICNDHHIRAVKPRLANILCKGTPLDINDEYIVMITKVRYLNRNHLDERVRSFWQVMNELSQKYKIVVLGERVVEPMRDYIGHNSNGTEVIYSIYNSIIEHIPNDRIIDLTIPALGITSPQLTQIQQDCLIMNKAKLIVTLGVGGGFCMATAVGNVVGYRIDQDPIADIVFPQEYDDARVTKDWGRFISLLQGYLQ